MRRFLAFLALGLLPLAAGCLNDLPAALRPRAAPAAPKDARARKLQALAELDRMKRKVRLEPGNLDLVMIGADLHGISTTGAYLDALGPLTKLHDLNLYHSDFTDADMARLRGAPELHTLNLSATRVTDAGLVCLPTLPSLRILYLADTRVGDAGLVHVRGLTNLQELSLFRTKVTDEGVMQLAGLKDLRKLTLGGTAVTDRGLAYLVARLPKLEVVQVTGTNVTAVEAERLRAAHARLQIVR